jgi:hypothetical protein
MRRCVRAGYGDLIFSGEVAGAFASADRLGGQCHGHIRDVVRTAIFAL